MEIECPVLLEEVTHIVIYEKSNHLIDFLDPIKFNKNLLTPK
jgi:hypothetical protein